MEHPLPEETLAAYLAGRLEGSPLEAVEAHLKSCPECAGRAEAQAAYQEVLSWSDGERPTARGLEAMQGVLPRSRRGSRRMLWAAAAAGVLLALGAWRVAGPPAPASRSQPDTSATSAGLTFLNPPGPAQILASSDALLKEAGDGSWRLDRGSCLAFAQGAPFRLAAGELELTLLEGEVLARVGDRPPAASLWMASAWAEASPPVEVVLISGSARLSVGGKDITIAAGERISCRGGEVLPPVHLGAGEGRTLLEDFLSAIPAPAAPGRTVGTAARKGEGWELDGRGGKAAWVAGAPGASYRASLRFRLRERPSALGVSFVVGTEPVLWPLDGDLLADGAWHTAHVLVGESCVLLVMDGRISHRAPRNGFRPNPEVGLDGVGLGVWGARAEVAFLRAEPLR
jgi:hypothetical protein